MIENFSLLTIVSNNNTNFAVYVSLLVIGWVLAACSLFSFMGATCSLCRVKYTAKFKWWMLPIALVLSSGIVAASVLLNFYDIKPEVWASLTTIGGLSFIYLIIFLIIKIVNCAKARKHHMTERIWCDLQWAKAMAKHIVRKMTIAGAAKLLSKMNHHQRKVFLSKAFRAYKILKRMKKSKFDLSNLLGDFEKIIKNIQTGKYDFFKTFVKEDDEPTVEVKVKSKKKKRK